MESSISNPFQSPGMTRCSHGVSALPNAARGGKLIAVIVSGYDGDGAVALRGISDVVGITIAQKLDTAGQPDMPQSAIASGWIDFVLSPEDIAREIVRIAQSARNELGQVPL